jgi:hypothetical protein
VTDAELWSRLRTALLGASPRVFEYKRIPADGTPCIVLAPEGETGVDTLGEAFDQGNAEIAFRVTCVSTEGWEAAMEMQPAARLAVESIPGAESIVLERTDFLVNEEGARPLFAVSLRYSGLITAA